MTLNPSKTVLPPISSLPKSMDGVRPGWLIVQDGSKYYTAIQMACSEDGLELNHLLVISGPFYTLAEAVRKTNE